MAFKVIVFDFDGTLIASNQLKHAAFFKLFPDDAHHARTVGEILARIGEASRYEILKEILTRLDGRQAVLQRDVNELADRYNALVLDGAKQCPEMPGAAQTLKSLAPAYRLYVSSTTPENSLKEIIRFRGWTAYFAGIFGYPHKKNATLRRILERENVDRTAVLVVGDGETDREAARENGCHFLQVDARFDFHHFQDAIENIQRSEA
jgi:phosphoglycolate phosphatase